MDQRTANLRKAAVLVAMLDRHSAESLLSQLSPDQADLVRSTVTELGPLDLDEQETVLREFLRKEPRVEQDTPGIELDGELAARLIKREPSAAGQPAWSDRRAAAPAPPEKTPFHFMHHADWETLAPLLENEHPQTIAVITAHLPQDQAASLLTALAPAIQVDVMRRLADLDELDAEIWAEIEGQLATWTTRQKKFRDRRRVGMDVVSGILQAADSGNKRILISNLRQHDVRLAERLIAEEIPLTVERLTFQQLLELDDRPLAAIVRQAEPELLVLALAGANRETIERVFEQLSPLETDRLRRELRGLGPTRLSDVEAAQAELVRLAQQLEKGNRIVLERRRLSVAA